MYPIKIRSSHPNGTDVSFGEAVRLAMSTEPGVATLYITAVYGEETRDGGRTRQAGEAVDAMSAEVLGRRFRYGQDTDAMIAMPGPGAHSPEIGLVRAQCYVLAAQIAAAANAAAAAVRAGEG